MPGDLPKFDFVCTSRLAARSYFQRLLCGPLNRTEPSRARAKLRLKPTEPSGPWKIGLRVSRFSAQRAFPPTSRLHHQVLRSRSYNEVAVQRGALGSVATTVVCRFCGSYW